MSTLRKTEDRPALGGVRDTVTVLGMTTLAMTGGVAVQACLAWLLGPEGRGSLAVCFTFATLLGTLFAFGLERSTQYHVLSGKLGLHRGIVLAGAVAFAGSALAYLTGVALIDSGWAFFAKAERASFMLSLTIMPTTVLVTALALLLNARRRFFASGLADLVGLAARLALLLGLIGLAGWGVEGALLAILLAGWITVAIQVVALLREPDHGPVSLPDRQTWRSIVGYGMRYYVARIGSIVNIRIGFLVLAVIAGPVEIGLYVAASTLIGRLQIVPDSISKALLPRIGPASGGRADLVARSCRASGLVVAAALLALVVSSPMIVPRLLSPAFAPTVPLLWILAPGILVRAATQPMAAYFIGVDRPGIVSAATAAQIATTVGLLPLLYPYLGLPAAAWAEAAGHAAAASVMAVGFARVSGLSLRATWGWHSSDGRLLGQIAERLRQRLAAGFGPGRSAANAEKV